MKLSDIKGERALDIIADAMELAEAIADDRNFKALGEELKALEDKNDAWRVFCRHIPKMLRNGEYRPRIMSILASAAGVPVEEYAADGDVLKDLKEFLLSDEVVLGFLSGFAAPTE